MKTKVMEDQGSSKRIIKCRLRVIEEQKYKHCDASKRNPELFYSIRHFSNRRRFFFGT